MSAQRYFGLYCEQCGTWCRLTDGSFVIYPAPEIANAVLNDTGMADIGNHLWRVQEFGKEERRIPSDAMRGQAICPLFHTGRRKPYIPK